MWIVKVDKEEIRFDEYGYLLNKDGSLKEFDSKGQAKRILIQMGINPDKAEFIEQKKIDE